ncbi:MAG: HAD-IIIA family hydrolase [Lachnospiraceae bacterium]|nr:HAD-IIIA family hydrolase [Lachnospiraceae bacterium]
MERCYDAVVFDLDGTLLDTLKDLADSTNAVLSHYGMPQRSMEEVRDFVGNGIRRLLQKAVPGGEANPDFGKAYDEFKDYYDKHCMDATEPYPGVLFLLTELHKKGIRMAIVSNKADFAVKKLCRVYFNELVEVAVGEREGCRRKPEPDSVLQALDEMGVPLERAVYVGDSEVDIQTAKNAGIDSIIVTWGFRSRNDLLAQGADPGHMAANVNELLAYLR